MISLAFANPIHNTETILQNVIEKRGEPYTNCVTRLLTRVTTDVCKYETRACTGLNQFRSEIIDFALPQFTNIPDHDARHQHMLASLQVGVSTL